ncbi:MAG TPA: hypothetical protein VH681_09120 [Nitrospiraceae bacterium]|jgi:hypothetical protein
MAEALTSQRLIELLGLKPHPGFESPDLELAASELLIAAYPTLRREIEAFSSR